VVVARPHGARECEPLPPAKAVERSVASKLLNSPLGQSIGPLLTSVANAEMSGL